MKDKQSIDTLRGLACLLLVGYHVVGSDPGSGLRVAEGLLRVLNDGLASVRMPLFTVLSGVVYGLRPFGSDTRAFLGGKVRRLLLPMLVVGTVFAAVQAATPGVNQASVDWRTVHLLPVAHFWFLEALFWVFLAVALLERSGRLASARGFALVMLAVTALHLVFRAPRWLGLEGALYLLPYFLAGLAVTRFDLWRALARMPVRVLLACVAVAAFVAMGVPRPDPDRQTIAMFGAGLALCGLLLGTGMRSAPLARLGASSYAVYLFHVFFAAAARIAMQRMGVDALPVQFAVALAAGLAGPVLVERLASGNRWTRWMLLGKRLEQAPKALTAAGARP